MARAGSGPRVATRAVPRDAPARLPATAGLQHRDFQQRGSVMSGDSLEFEFHPNPQPLPAAERESLLVNPGFGRLFTDHMVSIRYAHYKGWYDARVEPYGPISLDPATAVLHYAQGIFEGLKAYRTDDGGVALFRPEANAARFVASTKRMAMPPLPERIFLESLHRLIEVDQAWVPTTDEASLYLRPFMYAS